MRTLCLLSLAREKVGRRGPSTGKGRFLVTLRSGQGARTLSLRLGQNTDLRSKSWFFALAPLQAPFAVRFSALLRCHAAAAARRGSNSSDCGKTHPGPLAPPWAFPSAPELARCSARLRASSLSRCEAARALGRFRCDSAWSPGRSAVLRSASLRSGVSPLLRTPPRFSFPARPARRRTPRPC